VKKYSEAEGKEDEIPTKIFPPTVLPSLPVANLDFFEATQSLVLYLIDKSMSLQEIKPFDQVLFDR
jgi:hypothetical protein